jgi:hypothetical protein
MLRALFYLALLFLSGISSAEVLYSNDFTGAASESPVRSASVDPGLSSKIFNVQLDGLGHMSASSVNSGTSLRIKLSRTPFTSDCGINAIQFAAILRTPAVSGSWLGLGFVEDGNVSGMFASGANSGPWLQLSSGGIRIRGGHATTGSENLYLTSALKYTAGDVITVLMSYYPATGTVDLSINGTLVANGVVVAHILEGTSKQAPAQVKWFEVQCFNEPSSANGGAYLDRLVIETTGTSDGKAVAASVPTGEDILIPRASSGESVVALPQRDANTVWIDAAAFQTQGGWLLDTQFVHLMGAPYLIAAGVGTPVQDAQAVFEVDQPGTYRLWVRSRNWMKEHAPGQFQITLDDQAVTNVFGKTDSDKWVWEPAGNISFSAGKHTVTLKDLTGYYGRCAAVVLSKDSAYNPPDELDAFRKERARLTGVSLDPVDLGEYDVIVVGGGAAGCPAALASARTGARTALIQDRSVLGGNASIELGVPVMGASLYQSYARESGICEEVGRIKSHYGDPKLSRTFQQMAEAEPNLSVFMDMHVYAAVMDGNRIVAVKAFNSLTGEEYILRAKQFVDTTGDGWLGYFSGADYRVGRESQDEYNESLAPKIADNCTMSGCLMGNLKLGYGWEKTGALAPYTPPSWAYNLPPNPEFGRSVSSPSGDWWLEHPNDIDDIWHAEEARDELLRIIFGYWDFIKNKWDKKSTVENSALTYVPVTEAKRESRRLMGDVVLNQNDVKSARTFSDTIGHAGWSLDIHNSKGILSGRGGPYEFDQLVPQSNIPFRSLYSRNIENLLFAGRCMSVTHIALGTVRVEGTCAVTGQAAGTAAAMCAAKGVTPRMLAEHHIGELQQQLLLDDQYVPGVVNSDPGDLARKAAVSASSTAACDRVDKSFLLEDTGGRLQLYARYGLIYPTGSDGRIGDLYLYVRSPLKEEKSLSIKIRAAEDSREKDLFKLPVLAETTVLVPAGQDGYIKISPQCSVPTPFFVIEAFSGSGLQLPRAKKGHLGSRLMWQRGEDIANIGRPAVMMYTDPPLRYPVDYGASNIINGISRIVEQNPNMWKSDPDAVLPQWVELKWDAPQKISRVHLTFDTNLDMWRHEEGIPTEVVQGYEVQVYTGGGWKTVAAETDNFQRFRKHTFNPVTTDRLRIVVNKTGGDASARIYEVRVY